MKAKSGNPSPIALRFGILLAGNRRIAGLSQEELGRFVKIHRTEVSLLERGLRVPRLDTVIRLAAGLEIEPDDLIEGIGWQPGLKSFGVVYRDRNGDTALGELTPRKRS